MSENKNGHSKQVQSVYNSRIKNYARLALDDLALLAKRLPEDQQAEIFNEERMWGLFKALFQLDFNELASDKELARKKRQRLMPICYDLIMLLNNHSLAHLMAPVGTRYMMKEAGQLAFLKAIYYRTFDSDKEEE